MIFSLPPLKTILTGFACLLVCTPVFAQDKPAQVPDTLVFVNGDQLSGTLVRGVGDSVVFRSDMAGELTIPLAKVKELRSTGSFAVLKKNERVKRGELRPGTVTVADGNVTVASPIAEPETIPVNKVGFILDQATFDKEVERKAGFFYGWNGAVTAGATFVQSTQHGGTFNAGLSLVRTVPTVSYLQTRNRTMLNIAESYGTLTTPIIPQTDPPTPDSVVKTSIFHGDLERDQYFTQRFYALGATAFDHNFAQGLDLQSVFGGGIGWTPITTAKQQLDMKVDIHYEKQSFIQSTDPTVAPIPELNLIGSTIALAYRRTLPKKMLLTTNASILPAFNTPEGQPNAYSANGSVALGLPVWKRLSMSLSANDSFLNNPSPGYKKNSFQFVTGVSYSIH